MTTSWLAGPQFNSMLPPPAASACAMAFSIADSLQDPRLPWPTRRTGTPGSVPFVLVPALVLTWHHIKIVTGRTIVGGARVVSGAEKKSFDRGGPVWPPRSNAANDRLGGGLGGFAPPAKNISNCFEKI